MMQTAPRFGRREFRGGGISPPNFGGLAELVQSVGRPDLCPCPTLFLTERGKGGAGAEKRVCPACPIFCCPAWGARKSWVSTNLAPPPRGGAPHIVWGKGRSAPRVLGQEFTPVRRAPSVSEALRQRRTSQESPNANAIPAGVWSSGRPRCEDPPANQTGWIASRS